MGAGADDRLVLCYHAVSDRWSADLAISPQRLADQIEQLVDRGYKGVTFHQAVRGAVEGKLVAVTFDDGYLSVFRKAWPTLDRFGIPGTVFLTTDVVEKGPIAWSRMGRWIGTPHEAELEPMSWEQARSLSSAGWEIGSHTRTHPHLTELSDRKLEEELVGSRVACEDAMGMECRSLAFPYGEHDQRVVAATMSAGYSAAAALTGSQPGVSPLSWPRVAVFDDGPWSFRFKVSPLVRRSASLASIARATSRLSARASSS